jgi:cysteine desulfurase
VLQKIMIYLDNNATTQLDPLVFSAMLPCMEKSVGNPSSVHRFGQKAKTFLLDALKRSSQFFSVQPDELIFTSGATEALNSILRTAGKNRHIITSSLEHAAVIEPLKATGAHVTYLDPPLGKGAVTADQIKEVLQDNTQMIVLSGANNETGIKTDVETIAQVAEAAGVAFILDGVSLLGKAVFQLPTGVSAVCFSGHKIHAPPGIGLAIVRRGIKLPSMILGGPQQRGLRAGTENLPAIVGFAKALELLDEKWIKQMARLRNRLEEGIAAHLKDVVIHGKDEPRVCNTSNIAFLGIDGETLLMALDLAGLAASHGSACSSGTLETSRVLRSMGIEPRVVRASLRFSLSRFTTEEEIDRSIPLIIDTVNRLRHA